nr:hypothetical protein CFP56_72057 [Quercus suber]
MATDQPRANGNPCINRAAFLQHLQAATPTTYTAEFADEGKKGFMTDVYIYPTNAADRWTRRRSHIHVMCSDPGDAGGNRQTDIRLYDAHCTVRTYEGYYDFKKFKTQMQFPRGAGPPHGLRGILTRRIYDNQGTYLRDAFEEVCRYLYQESGLPDVEKRKWSPQACGEAPMVEYRRQWADMLDFFQGLCDMMMGAGAWDLKYRYWT